MGKHHKAPPKKTGPTPKKSELKKVKKFVKAATKVKATKAKATKGSLKNATLKKKVGTINNKKPNSISK